MTKVEHTVHYRIAGGIWWPMGALCWKDGKMQRGKGPFQREFDLNAEDIAEAISLHDGGDFSSIEGIEIALETRVWRKNHARVYRKMLAEFSEELAMRIMDAECDHA